MLENTNIANFIWSFAKLEAADVYHIASQESEKQNKKPHKIYIINDEKRFTGNRCNLAGKIVPAVNTTRIVLSR